MRAPARVVLGALSALLCGTLTAGVLLQPIDAPEWEISEWVKNNPGKLSDLRGKIVLINFFQLWCPGSISFSVPLFQHWQELYGDRDDFVVVSIHSVFEGRDVQTPARLRTFVRENRINHAVGIDAHAPGDDVPITMRRFNAEGTPQVVIVDKEGKIRFSHFGVFDPKPVEFFIGRLLEESESEDAEPSANDSGSTPHKGRGRRGRRK